MITNKNPNKTSSSQQRARILKHLMAGKKITALQALDKFKCFRLAARIHELKKVHPIKSEWVKQKGGKKVKRYYLRTSG